MAFIAQPIVGDQRIQLGNEEFLRTFNFGNQWTNLRIAGRLTINDYQTAIFPGVMAIGVSNGNWTSYAKPVPLMDWVGIQIGPYVSGWLYNAGATANFSVPQGGSCPLTRKVGAVVTTVTPGNNTGNYVNSSKAGPSGFLVTISRTTALSYTIVWWGGANATTISRITSLYNAESTTTGLLQGVTAVSITGGSYYDTLSIYWNNSTPTLEISDLTVVRLA